MEILIRCVATARRKITKLLISRMEKTMPAMAAALIRSGSGEGARPDSALHDLDAESTRRGPHAINPRP